MGGEEGRLDHWDHWITCYDGLKAKDLQRRMGRGEHTHTSGRAERSGSLRVVSVIQPCQHHVDRSDWPWYAICAPVWLLAGSSLSLANVCAQNLLPGQPAASCVIQIIASNGTVWAGVVDDVPSGGGGGGDGASGGLAAGQKAAIVVASVVGGLILIVALVAVLYMSFRLKQRMRAPAKGEVDGGGGMAVGGEVQLQDWEAESAVAVEGAEGGPPTVPGTPSTVRNSPTQARLAVEAAEGEARCELGPEGPLASPLRSGTPGSLRARVLITLDPAGL